MYVELYILDNWLMNVLILRLAACFLGLRPGFFRIALLSGVGAIYAVFALFFKLLLHPVLKIALCFIMAFSLKPDGARDYFIKTGVVALATLLAGGIAYALALAFGGESNGGLLIAPIPLRIIIYTAAILAFLPNLIRRIRRNRVSASLYADIIIEHEGELFSMTGFIDTGNTLKDPITALPGVLVFCPDLSKYAFTPLFAHGAFGQETILGFKPDRFIISGQEAAVMIYVANTDLPFSGAEFQALIPPDVLPFRFENNMEVVKCETHSEHL